MVKLEEKLKDMDLEKARNYRTAEWIKGGVGGACVFTGFAAVPGAVALGLVGGGLGLIGSPEAAVALGSVGAFSGGIVSYVATGIYTAKKVYNAIGAGQKVKDLEQKYAKEDKKE